jgi:hypothetical protein
MGDFVGAIGQAIGSAVQTAINAVGAAFSNVVHTADAWIPGGFPIFVVLGVIGILVGLAAWKR